MSTIKFPATCKLAKTYLSFVYKLKIRQGRIGSVVRFNINLELGIGLGKSFRLDLSQKLPRGSSPAVKGCNLAEK
jgi:hypothetical protein